MVNTLAFYMVGGTLRPGVYCFAPHLLPIGVHHSYPLGNIGAHAFISWWRFSKEIAEPLVTDNAGFPAASPEVYECIWPPNTEQRAPALLAARSSSEAETSSVRITLIIISLLVVTAALPP